MYKVEVNSDSGYVFAATAGESQYLMNSQISGGSPLDVLLAALGGCIGVYIRKYAEGAKLDIGKIKITVQAELSSERPMSFKKIQTQVDLGHTILDQRRIAGLLEFIKNCPVHNTLKGSPEVEVKIG